MAQYVYIEEYHSDRFHFLETMRAFPTIVYSYIRWSVANEPVVCIIPTPGVKVYQKKFDVISYFTFSRHAGSEVL